VLKGEEEVEGSRKLTRCLGLVTRNISHIKTKKRGESLTW